MHLDSGFQHAESPGVDADRPIKGFAVEAADVTVRIMKAHQPVNAGNRLECGIDRLIDPGSDRSRDFDLHKGPEQWSDAAYPI